MPPEWAIILEAAHGDPLRAQEIEESVSAEWWHRWLADRNTRAEVQASEKKKS
jgi:hypothetical protein